MAARFTIIDGMVLLSAKVKMPDSGEPSDIICKTCGNRNMRIIFDITQYGFDRQKDTLYLQCETCESVYHTSFVVLYSENEG